MHVESERSSNAIFKITLEYHDESVEDVISQNNDYHPRERADDHNP